MCNIVQSNGYLIPGRLDQCCQIWPPEINPIVDGVYYKYIAKNITTYHSTRAQISKKLLWKICTYMDTISGIQTFGITGQMSRLCGHQITFALNGCNSVNCGVSKQNKYWNVVHIRGYSVLLSISKSARDGIWQLYWIFVILKGTVKSLI